MLQEWFLDKFCGLAMINKQETKQEQLFGINEEIEKKALENNTTDSQIDFTFSFNHLSS